MKPKVDNFDLIKPLLKWEKEGQFYYIQLLKRKKDGTTKYSNKNNSSRLVNKYCIYNIEQFEEKEKEIKGICDLLKCRAGIHLNKLTDETVTKEAARRFLDAVISENYHTNGTLESIYGSHITSKEKKVFIDIDTKDEEILNKTISFINSLQPFDKTNKVLQILPTYSGFHLVSENFRKDHFTEFCNNEKDVSFEGSLCALYYPEQL